VAALSARRIAEIPINQNQSCTQLLRLLATTMTPKSVEDARGSSASIIQDLPNDRAGVDGRFHL